MTWGGPAGVSGSAADQSNSVGLGGASAGGSKVAPGIIAAIVVVRPPCSAPHDWAICTSHANEAGTQGALPRPGLNGLRVPWTLTGGGGGIAGDCRRGGVHHAQGALPCPILSAARGPQQKNNTVLSTLEACLAGSWTQGAQLQPLALLSVRAAPLPHHMATTWVHTAIHHTHNPLPLAEAWGMHARARAEAAWRALEEGGAGAGAGEGPSRAELLCGPRRGCSAEGRQP